jgi:hypothetical protein
MHTPENNPHINKLVKETMKMDLQGLISIHLLMIHNSTLSDASLSILYYLFVSSFYIIAYRLICVCL